VPVVAEAERQHKRSSAVVQVRSPKEQRKAYSKAWLSLLRLPLPVAMYKTVRRAYYRLAFVWR
jgi:hypothetical protein